MDLMNFLPEFEHPLVAAADEVLGRLAGTWMPLVEELDDVESEPIHVEVDVARLEIGRAGLPDANLGVESFAVAKPRSVSYHVDKGINL